MHPNAMPIPNEYQPAQLCFDHDSVSFHVMYPWKPTTMGLTFGEIEMLPAGLQNGVFFMDSVDDVIKALSGLRYTIHDCAFEELNFRDQLPLLLSHTHCDSPEP